MAPLFFFATKGEWIVKEELAYTPSDSLVVNSARMLGDMMRRMKGPGSAVVEGQPRVYRLDLSEKEFEELCSLQMRLNVAWAEEARQPEIATREFEVSYQFSAIGSTVIDVPANFTREEALKYAEDNITELALPQDWEYLSGSDVLDEENCQFVD